MNKKPAIDLFGPRLLLDPTPPVTRIGDIELPESAQKKETSGTVIAVGDGRLLESGARLPVRVAVGAQVLYGKYAGAEIEIDGEKYVVLEEDQVIGVLAG